MNIVLQPLTKKEIKEQADESGFVEGVVPVELSALIDNNFEEFLDLISEKLVGSPTLMEVQYEVSHSPLTNEDEHTVMIKVSGNASVILEE